MWVKKQPAEIIKSKSSTRNKLWISSVMFGIFVSLMTTFFNTSYSSKRTLFVQPDEVPRRIPFSLTFGFITTLLSYWYRRKDKTVICPKCGHAKIQNTTQQMKCSCGGIYAELDEYKWSN